jgi:hypothetical protein
MPSPVFQNMVNLVMRLSIRTCRIEFMNVTVWDITDFMYTFIPNCWFENVFPADFGIEIA